MLVPSSQIKNTPKLLLLTTRLAAQPKSIIIFGLPYTGKTTLATAIQQTDKRRVLIDEWMSNKDTERIRKEKNLVVTSQYLVVEKQNSEQELEQYLLKQGLKHDEWLLVLIYR